MKHFEDEYKAYIKDSTPDLWDRIEKALPERHAEETGQNSAAAAPSGRFSHKMVWRMASAAAGICVILTAATVLNLHYKSAESGKTDSIEAVYEEETAAEDEAGFADYAEDTANFAMYAAVTENADEVYEDAAQEDAEPETAGEAAISADPEIAVNSVVYDLPLPAEGELLSVTAETMACPWDPEKDLLYIGLRGRADQDISALLHVDFSSAEITGYRCVSLGDPDAADIRAELARGSTYAVLYEVGYRPEETVQQEAALQADQDRPGAYSAEVTEADTAETENITEVRATVDAAAVMHSSSYGTMNENIAKAAEAVSAENNTAMMNKKDKFY